MSALHALEVYDEVHDENSLSIPSFHFDIHQVKELSKLSLVQQSFSLGTVLAVTIRPDETGGTGYAAASRTVPITKMLRERGVFARPLGNVLYIMCSPLTRREECTRQCETLAAVIESYGEELEAKQTRVP